jgi:predicted esterase
MKFSLILSLAVLFFFAFKMSARAADPAVPASPPSLAPNAVLRFQFSELPATFYSKKTGNKIPAQISAQLPSNYTEAGKYPLFVYLDGGYGSAGDDLAKARAIMGEQDFIAVSLPLFKAGDIPVSAAMPLVDLTDYIEIGLAYTTMLQKLLDTVPNVDTSRSAICGFSNGGHTIADILIEQGPFFMKTFHSFVLVEGGIPLGAHRELFDTPGFKSIRFMMLLGEHPEAQAAIDQFKAQLNASCPGATILAMPGVGHEFPEKYYPTVRAWVREEKPVMP